MKASNLAPKNRLRRRQKDGIAPADAMSPLDSDEQEEVVANLAQEAWRQTALIKVSEGVLNLIWKLYS